MRPTLAMFLVGVRELSPAYSSFVRCTPLLFFNSFVLVRVWFISLPSDCATNITSGMVVFLAFIITLQGVSCAGIQLVCYLALVSPCNIHASATSGDAPHISYVSSGGSKRADPGLFLFREMRHFYKLSADEGIVYIPSGYATAKTLLVVCWVLAFILDWNGVRCAGIQLVFYQ